MTEEEEHRKDVEYLNNIFPKDPAKVRKYAKLWAWGRRDPQGLAKATADYIEMLGHPDKEMLEKLKKIPKVGDIMDKLDIPKKELKKITKEQKELAFHLAMPIGWNPEGDSKLFKEIQENIFNYFLGRKHNLSDREIKLVKEQEEKEYGR